MEDYMGRGCGEKLKHRDMAVETMICYPFSVKPGRAQEIIRPPPYLDNTGSLETGTVDRTTQ